MSTLNKGLLQALGLSAAAAQVVVDRIEELEEEVAELRRVAKASPPDVTAIDAEIEMTQARWDSLMATGMKPVVAVAKIMKKYHERLAKKTP